MTTVDVLKSIVGVLVGGSGAIALLFTARQLAVRRRAHILEVYRQAFSMLDAADMRDARHYVYDCVAPDTHSKEHWLELKKFESDPNYQTWKEHEQAAEKVGRAFDQLGLLIREGRMPINVLVRFYASPALRCWRKLWPYINACRDGREPKQPGHMWEWQNLVDFIIKKLGEDKGVWRGVSKHDNLESLTIQIRQECVNMLRDTEYQPAGHTWELAPWYRVWMW